MKQTIDNLSTDFCCVALLLCLSLIVRADHGDPDPTFGHIGVKIDHVSGKTMFPRAIAQQADGKLLVAGTMTGNGYPFPMLLLRRYNTSGSVDTGFGLSGFGVEELNNQAWYIYGETNKVALQSDGRIIVAGGSYDLSSTRIKPTIFRFTPYGDLDMSFGDHGRVIFDDGGEGVTTSGLAIFKEKILTLLWSQSGYNLIRLNSNGTLDTAFGASGLRSVGINAITLATNRATGKIIVGGSSLTSPSEFALQHFNINGTPDTAHGIDGIAALQVAPGCAGFFARDVRSIDTQADGKIIAGCSCGSPGWAPLNVVVRILSDDTLDTSFGNGGYAQEFDLTRSDVPSIVRVSRSTTQITTAGHPGTSGLKRYSGGGVFQLSYSITGIADFLIQSSDEKPVTIKPINNGDIQLRRFLP